MIANPSSVLAPVAGHYRSHDDYHTERPEGNLDWLIIYSHQGEGFCGSGGPTTPLVAGDLLLIEPKFPHEYGRLPEGKWALLYVHFLARPDWRMIIKAVPEITPGQRLLKVPLKVRPLVMRIFFEIIRNAVAHTSYGDLLAMHQIERLFLVIYQCAVPPAEQLLDSRILRVTQYIEEHLNLPLQLDDLAARSGMSKYRLAHLFSAQVGDTPHRFIMAQRMKKACDLLKTTTLTIGEIAYQTGFSNPAHFSQQFSRRLKCSPGKYRVSGAPLLWG